MSEPQRSAAASPHEPYMDATDDAPLAAAERPAHELTDAQITALIEAYLAGESDCAKLAQRTGLSLLAIVRWVAEPSSRRLIQGMMHMQEVGNQCFANLTHRSAIARLVQISRDDAKPDVARKACVDLLKVAPGAGRSLCASRMLALDERSRNEAAENPSAKRPTVSVSQQQVDAAIDELLRTANRSDDDDDDDDGGDRGDSRETQDQPSRAGTPCVITLRREPLKPRQDLNSSATRGAIPRMPRRDSG